MYSLLRLFCISRQISERTREERIRQMYSKASVVIVEQPAKKLARLGGVSDNRTDTLVGVETTCEKTTYPSIKIVNYTGMASVVMSCVTGKKPYLPHPNEIVGKNCVKGICYVAKFSTNSSEPSILSFPDLRIRCCKKKDIAKRLSARRRLNIDPFNHSSEDDDQMDRDLHTVRLCFQVTIRNPKNPKRRIQFKPKVTRPITITATELNIHDMSDACSSAHGGKKIMIYCNVFANDDIQIRFFEEDAEKNEIWVDWGTFQPYNVHQNVGIVVTTPKYGVENIVDARNVFIELVRRSDNTRSNRLPFQYVPDVTNVEVVMTRKHRKIDESKPFFEFLGKAANFNFSYVNDERENN